MFKREPSCVTLDLSGAFENVIEVVDLVTRQARVLFNNRTHARLQHSLDEFLISNSINVLKFPKCIKNYNSITDRLYRKMLRSKWNWLTIVRIRQSSGRLSIAYNSSMS